MCVTALSTYGVRCCSTAANGALEQSSLSSLLYCVLLLTSGEHSLTHPPSRGGTRRSFARPISPPQQVYIMVKRRVCGRPKSEREIFSSRLRALLLCAPARPLNCSRMCAELRILMSSHILIMRGRPTVKKVPGAALKSAVGTHALVVPACFVIAGAAH